MSRGDRTAVVAWLVTSVYYFHQYALRSAPAVMMPEPARRGTPVPKAREV